MTSRPGTGVFGKCVRRLGPDEWSSELLAPNRVAPDQAAGRAWKKRPKTDTQSTPFRPLFDPRNSPEQSLRIYGWIGGVGRGRCSFKHSAWTGSADSPCHGERRRCVQTHGPRARAAACGDIRMSKSGGRSSHHMPSHSYPRIAPSDAALRNGGFGFHGFLLEVEEENHDFVPDAQHPPLRGSGLVGAIGAGRLSLRTSRLRLCGRSQYLPRHVLPL